MSNSDNDNSIIVGEVVRERRSALGRLYHGETAIDFYGRRWIGLGLSAVLLLVSLGSLLFSGLNLSIDFKGGVVWEVPSDTMTEQEARDVLDANGLNGAEAKVQILTNSNSGHRTLRVQVGTEGGSSEQPTATTEASSTTVAATTVPATTDPATTEPGASTSSAPVTTDAATTTTTVAPGTNSGEVEAMRLRVQAAFAEKVGVSVEEVASSSVSSTWGSTITEKAVRALVVFMVLVALFIAWRLEWRMATAAIGAMLHDVLLSVGVYSLLGFEVTPATVVAFLTILGFSLYDTIVVFDKLQENQRRYSGARLPYADVMNVSMNQVLMRSLNTSLAAVLPVLSLLVIGAGIMGAVTLAEFALALLVGLITGSYSSIFVASPLVAIAKEREPKFRSMRDRHATGVELERLVHGALPSGRREARLKTSDGSDTITVASALSPEAVLTHTPRPRKKKRR